MDFKSALKIVLLFERGYVNDPFDPGGETNFGITKRVAQENGYNGDMKSIPMDFVETVYRKKYWDAMGLDSFPDELKLIMFDSGVNSGIGYAIKWLQRAIGVKDDGVLGPKTRGAIKKDKANEISNRMCIERLLSLVTFPGFSRFGQGWVKRTALIMKGL